MVEQMVEGTALEGDAQGAQVREIRLPQLPGLVKLGEIRLFGRTLQGAPDLHPALKGAQLPVGKRAGVLALQVLEQLLGLQARVVVEQVLQLRPYLLEGIDPGAPRRLGGQLARQLPRIAVLTRGLLVHAGLGGGHGQRLLGSNQLHQSPHLGVGNHLTSSVYRGLE